MSAPVSPPAARRVTPGCLLLIVGGVWLLVLGGWMIWSLFAQVREMRAFTDPVAKEVVAAQPNDEQKALLRARINEFGAAAGRSEKTSLRLTVDDLNNLLASEEAAKSMKGSAKVESIGDTLRVQISVKMNGIPFTDEHLFLNGFATLAVEPDKEKGLRLMTKDLSVPGKTISEGFMNTYKEKDHLDTLLLEGMRNSSDPAIMTVLKKVTTVRLEPGAVILESTPPAKP